VVHLALLAAGNCKPCGRLPVVQLTALRKQSVEQYFSVCVELCLLWIETVFRLSMTGRSPVEGTMIQ
jgi:hypothetical protein